MKLLSPSFRRSWTSSRAFTMVEIALSIAVVAFAMVAILGVLPRVFRYSETIETRRSSTTMVPTSWRQFALVTTDLVASATPFT